MTLQGVAKERVREVLVALGLARNEDTVDVLYALLDNETPSWFSRPPAGATFADGATTAHLACHVGILQRGAGKLDREGRDYWIKPLREVGIVEPVTLLQGKFVPSHPIPKSPNSAYRLATGFADLLRLPDDRRPSALERWASEDAKRQRRERQAQLEKETRETTASPHRELIRISIEYYASQFLPDYKVIYVDEGDGDRITDEDRDKLRIAGIELQLGDAMPDVLLWNRLTDRLWVIEAVTTDGEVDSHKVERLQDLTKRHGKKGIDFTTAYRTWKDLAARQAAHGNAASGTYLWVADDPGRQLYIASHEPGEIRETTPLFDQSLAGKERRSPDDPP